MPIYTSFVACAGGCSNQIQVILNHAGKDATDIYSSIHSSSLIREYLGADKLKGTFDSSTITPDWMGSPLKPAAAHQAKPNERPPVGTIMNADEFQQIAARTTKPKTYAFYASAANDEVTRDANRAMLQRIFFRPRYARDVTEVDTKTIIMGCPVKFPLFVSPAALAKLIHPDGELAIARACESRGVVQGVSNNAAYSIHDIAHSGPSGSYFFQLYINRDRARSAALLRDVSANPRVRAIFVTVCAPWPGKRESDERLKSTESIRVPMSPSKETNDTKGGGLGRGMSQYIDPGVTWETLRWVRQFTHLPLIVKGILSADDAILAMRAGMNGILLSNHGGRNLDTSPPSIVTLLELHKRCPEVFDVMEVYVDSGIRRGGDVLKAVCLGATAVGVGRSALFATNYGQEGVEKLLDSKYSNIPMSRPGLGCEANWGSSLERRAGVCDAQCRADIARRGWARVRQHGGHRPPGACTGGACVRAPGASQPRAPQPGGGVACCRARAAVMRWSCSAGDAHVWLVKMRLSPLLFWDW